MLLDATLNLFLSHHATSQFWPVGRKVPCCVRLENSQYPFKCWILSLRRTSLLMVGRDILAKSKFLLKWVVYPGEQVYSESPPDLSQKQVPWGNTGDDFHLTTAPTTGFTKSRRFRRYRYQNPLQTPSPGHCYVVFQRLVYLSLRGCFAFFLPLTRSVGVINSEFAAQRHQFLVVARLTGNLQETML